MQAMPRGEACTGEGPCSLGTRLLGGEGRGGYVVYLGNIDSLSSSPVFQVPLPLTPPTFSLVSVTTSTHSCSVQFCSAKASLESTL